MKPEDEHVVRTIVREEILSVLGVLGRAAAHEYRMTGSEIAERAACTIEAVAEATAKRLVCSHPEHYAWGTERHCTRCGEPEELPADPFQDHEHVHDISEGEPTACIECGAPYRREG